MRKLVVLFIVIAAALPLLAQGGGNQGGSLGEVNALGQSVRRPRPAERSGAEAAERAG